MALIIHKLQSLRHIAIQFTKQTLNGMESSDNIALFSFAHW